MENKNNNQNEILLNLLVEKGIINEKNGNKELMTAVLENMDPDLVQKITLLYNEEKIQNLKDKL